MENAGKATDDDSKEPVREISDENKNKTTVRSEDEEKGLSDEEKGRVDEKEVVIVGML